MVRRCTLYWCARIQSESWVGSKTPRLCRSSRPFLGMEIDKFACSRSVPWVRFGLTRPGLPLSVWPNRRETEKFDKLLRPRWLACQAPRRFLESRQGLVELGGLLVALIGMTAAQEGRLGQVILGGLQEKGWWKVFVTAGSGVLLSLFVMCLVMGPLVTSA